MDDYRCKVKAEEKTAQTLALIHIAGLQEGYDTGWSFELMHDILKQSRQQQTMIPNFSSKFLIAIKHQQITARRKYSLPFFNSQVGMQAYNKVYTKQQRMQLVLQVDDVYVDYDP